MKTTTILIILAIIAIVAIFFGSNIIQQGVNTSSGNQMSGGFENVNRNKDQFVHDPMPGEYNIFGRDDDINPVQFKK